MEGDEDEPSNVYEPSLQFEDNLVSNRDEYVEFHGSEMPCESEFLPPSLESQSVAPRIAGEDDIDVVLGEERVELGADSVAEKRDLMEEMTIVKEEVVGDFVEDTVGEREEKVENCVPEVPLERENLVAHSAQEIDVQEMSLFNAVEETFAVGDDDVQEKADVTGIFNEKEETEDAGQSETVEEMMNDNMIDVLQEIKEVYVSNVVDESVIVVKGEGSLVEQVTEGVEEVGVADGLKDTGFSGHGGYARDIDAVIMMNVTNAGLNRDAPKKAEEAGEASATGEEGTSVTDKSAIVQGIDAVNMINATEENLVANDGDVSDFEKEVEEIKQVSVVDEEEETSHPYMVDNMNDTVPVSVTNVMEPMVAVKGEVPEMSEDIDYVKDGLSPLNEFDLAVPLQDSAQEVYTSNFNESLMKERMAYAMDDVGEDKAEGEMENMADDTAEDEMDNIENDIVDTEEMAEMGLETAGAVAITNVTDDMVEGEDAQENDILDMDVYVTDVAADDAQEMELLDEVEEVGRGSTGGKRKRGRNSKAPARMPTRKKVEEDVCFICFDGGDLVLCDRRGCPKAYHPSCVNRDEAFFQAKGRWTCGWHLCSNCGKTANYMCFTCAFSLCKSCIKDAIIFCVRGNKGFCETCMKTVMLIEKNEHGSRETGQVDFNDKSSWEYLFKDYWSDVKQKLSLTFDELTQAKVPWKGSDMLASKQESPLELDASKVDRESNSYSSGNLDSNVSKRKKPKKLLKSRSKERDSSQSLIVTNAEGVSTADRLEWASQELLEFVMHMRNGDGSLLSQFDVQALLLEYIKRNKLRDPRRKSQIICDIRLENLFGKPRVGHFEMLKLLESHFLIKEDSQADNLQGSVVDTESSQMEVDGNTDAIVKASKDRKRKGRKKSGGKGLQYNVDDYAAIDTHNINLIYLRRNLVEELIDDIENFHNKVVGTFVRIRISGNAQKQDLYRLVQVVGTSKAGEPYKVGKKKTNILLEILNLNKTEIISSDIISNQEFTQDECKRLRQSIKCGLLSRLTVGDIQEKAMALQEVRVKDWLEAEIVRVSHLRDRASETGRRKEECVEKLQLLKTPEERQRRLEEIAEIHSDPNMDPSHESEEEEENYSKPRSNNGFGKRAKETISPRKGGSTSSDNWSGMRNLSNMNMEANRNLLGKGNSNKTDNPTGSSEITHDYSRNQGRETDMQQSISSEEKKQSFLILEISRNVQSTRELHIPTAPLATVTSQSDSKINEAEKIWHYKDPSGKVQGPFSIVQLRKWSTTGYFPADLRIWRIDEKQDDSILLANALVGKFQKDSAQKSNLLSPSFESRSDGALDTRSNLGSSVPSAAESYRFQNDVSSAFRVSPKIEISKYSADGGASDYGGIRKESINLPSPTPSPSAAKAPQLIPPISEASSFSGGGNGGLQHSAIFMRENAARGSENTLQMLSESTGVAPALAEAALNPSADIKSISANLQSLVQSLNSRNAPIQTEMNAPGPAIAGDSRVWGSVPSYKVEASNNNASAIPAQLPHGQWVDPQGNFPAAPMANLPPSGTWRPPVHGGQPNMPSPAPASTNLPWGPHQGNPNIGWTGAMPTVINPNWAAQGPPPIGNLNQGWAAPPQGPAPGNAVPSWGGAYNQPPQPANANAGWIPPPANPPNPGWAPSPGNVGMGRPATFNGGGGFPRPAAFKGQRVCKFHESGHCKKGAACDYLHS